MLPSPSMSNGPMYSELTKPLPGGTTTCDPEKNVVGSPQNTWTCQSLDELPMMSWSTRSS